jgi:Flp pilus assembly protein TadG
MRQLDTVISASKRHPVGKRAKRGSRRGAAAIEFALVFPIFLLCVLGIVEIGRAIMVHQILTNGAREGARRAIIPGATDDQVHQMIDNYMTNTTISGHTRQITPSLADADPHDPLVVTVSVPYSEVDWGIVHWIAGDAELTASVVMRKE